MFRTVRAIQDGLNKWFLFFFKIYFGENVCMCGVAQGRAEEEGEGQDKDPKQTPS